MFWLFSCSLCRNWFTYVLCRPWKFGLSNPWTRQESWFLAWKGTSIQPSSKISENFEYSSLCRCKIKNCVLHQTKLRICLRFTTSDYRFTRSDYTSDVLNLRQSSLLMIINIMDIIQEIRTGHDSQENVVWHEISAGWLI